MSRGRPFESGNKLGCGRPKGSRNKLSPVEQFLKQHQVSLCNKGVASALRDNTRALIWCLNRLDRMDQSSQKLKLPKIRTLDDIANSLGVVLNAVANRTRTAAEGQVLLTTLEKHQKLIETQELASRVEELERQIKVLSK
jgi:hypothetical protein